MFDLLRGLFYFDSDQGEGGGDGAQGGMDDLLDFAQGSDVKVFDQEDIKTLDKNKSEEELNKKSQDSEEPSGDSPESDKAEDKPSDIAAKSTEKADASEEVSESDEEKDRISALMDELEAMSANVNALSLDEEPIEQKPKSEEKDTEDLEEEKKTDVTPEKSQQASSMSYTPVDFAGDEDDYMSYLKDKEGLNTFGNKVMEASISSAYQAVVTNIMPVIAKAIPKYVEIKLETERFYEENPDLEAVKTYTARVFALVDAKHPSKTLREKFELTGKEVRKKLGLPMTKGQAVDSKNSTKKNGSPKFAPNRGGVRPQSGKDEGSFSNPMEQQIDEMLRVAQS